MSSGLILRSPRNTYLDTCEAFYVSALFKPRIRFKPHHFSLVFSKLLSFTASSSCIELETTRFTLGSSVVSQNAVGTQAVVCEETIEGKWSCRWRQFLFYSVSSLAKSLRFFLKLTTKTLFRSRQMSFEMKEKRTIVRKKPRTERLQTKMFPEHSSIPHYCYIMHKNIVGPTKSCWS